MWKLQRKEGAQQDRKQEGELTGEEMVALQLLYRLRCSTVAHRAGRGAKSGEEPRGED